MPIQVVGLGLDTETLPEVYASIIDGAHVLVGGKRQLAMFEGHPAEKIYISGPLADVFASMAKLDSAGKDIVVLADGDPMFFGVGARLIDEFGPEDVHVLPNVTSLQGAAALAKVPWQEVVTISLHGRNNYRPLYKALRDNDWVAVLTDDTNIPAAIAQKLVDRGIDWFSMWVFENIGSENQKFDRYSLAQAGARSFSRLNLVLLEREGTSEKPLRLGTDDAAYTVEKGLITKWPVRAAGIAALRIEPDNVVWDLGAGCGSVGIEASALLGEGEVFAVERNGSRIGMIRENRQRFGAVCVDIVHGTMPACLCELPDPHRIFIGGGLGKSDELLLHVKDRLLPDGRIVIHSILLGTVERTRAFFAKQGWTCDVTLVQASVSSELAGDLRLESYNPVFILSAKKP